MTDQDVNDANWAADAVARLLERIRKALALEYMRRLQQLRR